MIQTAPQAHNCSYLLQTCSLSHPSHPFSFCHMNMRLLCHQFIPTVVLRQHPPQHKQPQLTPQINHYKSNIFNLPLEPYGLHVTTAEGPCSRATLAFWRQSHLLSWWLLVLSACRRLPGQQAQHTALTLPPVCMFQQGWVTSPSPIYHDRNPPVKSGFN